MLTIPIIRKSLLFLGVLILISCSKEKTPDYPMLIGYWQGQTLQGNPVELTVDCREGILYITRYKILVTFSSGQTMPFEAASAGGLATLSGLAFTVPLGSGSLGPAYLQGMFDPDGAQPALTGTYSVYYPASSVDMESGSYTAYLYHH